MIGGNTSVAAFVWWWPAVVADVWPWLVLLTVFTAVSVLGLVAALLLVTRFPSGPHEREVDPGRLVPMSRSRRRLHRTGAVCRTADDTVEIPR